MTNQLIMIKDYFKFGYAVCWWIKMQVAQALEKKKKTFYGFFFGFTLLGDFQILAFSWVSLKSPKILTDENLRKNK